MGNSHVRLHDMRFGESAVRVSCVGDSFLFHKAVNWEYEASSSLGTLIPLSLLHLFESEEAFGSYVRLRSEKCRASK